MYSPSVYKGLHVHCLYVYVVCNHATYAKLHSGETQICSLAAATALERWSGPAGLPPTRPSNTAVSYCDPGPGDLCCWSCPLGDPARSEVQLRSHVGPCKSCLPGVSGALVSCLLRNQRLSSLLAAQAGLQVLKITIRGTVRVPCWSYISSSTLMQASFLTEACVQAGVTQSLTSDPALKPALHTQTALVSPETRQS